MATPEDVASVRRATDEPDTTNYTDETIGQLLDTLSSVERVAATIWREKAARYSSLVDVSESGSSRSMGDLHKNALAMAKFYGEPTAEEGKVAAGPFTVQVVRG